MSNAFRLSLAPDKLWQQIDPWKFYQQGAQFGFINIDLGNTQHPELEQKILDEVGSYGRQLGHTLLPQSFEQAKSVQAAISRVIVH